MKQIYLAGILAGLLALPGTSRAQHAALAAASSVSLPVPSHGQGLGQKVVLGGPPPAPRPQAADTAGLDASPTYLARLRQLHLPADPAAAQPGTAPAGGALPVEELARVFPQAVRQRPAFLPNVAAPATATAVGAAARCWH